MNEMTDEEIGLGLLYGANLQAAEKRAKLLLVTLAATEEGFAKGFGEFDPEAEDSAYIQEMTQKALDAAADRVLSLTSKKINKIFDALDEGVEEYRKVVAEEEEK